MEILKSFVEQLEHNWDLMDDHCETEDGEDTIESLKKLKEIAHKIVLDNKAGFIIRGLGGNCGGDHYDISRQIIWVKKYFCLWCEADRRELLDVDAKGK